MTDRVLAADESVEHGIVTQYRIYTAQRRPVGGALIGDEALQAYLEDRLYGERLDHAWAAALREEQATPATHAARYVLADLLTERPYIVMRRRIGPWEHQAIRHAGTTRTPVDAILVSATTHGTLRRDDAEWLSDEIATQPHTRPPRRRITKQ